MSGYQYVPLSKEARMLEMLRLGHFHAEFGGSASKSNIERLGESNAKTVRALKSYQRFSGLKADGKFGPHTDEAIRNRTDAFGNPRICGCPDIPLGVEEVNISNGTQTWPDPHLPIGVYQDFNLPGLTKAQCREAFQLAFDDIASKIGVRLQFASKSQAHIVLRKEPMSGGTLAYALLSLGHRRIGGHYQAYANNRQWSVEPQPAVSLVAVAIHELGHTLGFSHSRDRAAIMWPSYNPAIPRLSSSDVNRMLRYYPQLPDAPKPEPPDEPPTGEQPMKGRFQFGDRAALFEGTATWL